MLDFFKNLALSFWNNHKKTALGFLLGILFMILAKVTGIPLADIKDAAKDAASAPAAVVAPVAAPAPAVPAPAK